MSSDFASLLMINVKKAAVKYQLKVLKNSKMATILHRTGVSGTTLSAKLPKRGIARTSQKADTHNIVVAVFLCIVCGCWDRWVRDRLCTLSRIVSRRRRHLRGCRNQKGCGGNEKFPHRVGSWFSQHQCTIRKPNPKKCATVQWTECSLFMRTRKRK